MGSCAPSGRGLTWVDRRARPRAGGRGASVTAAVRRYVSSATGRVMTTVITASIDRELADRRTIGEPLAVTTCTAVRRGGLSPTIDRSCGLHRVQVGETAGEVAPDGRPDQGRTRTGSPPDGAGHFSLLLGGG